MKSLFYALVATLVSTLSAQKSFAIDEFCLSEAQRAAEAIHEINNPGVGKITADKVEAVGYKGFHVKEYQAEFKMSNGVQKYSVSVFEYENPDMPQCQIDAVVTLPVIL